MPNILENIFSIKDYGGTHHILRLFGLKIKFPNREFSKKIKESLAYKYKKNNTDITTLPAATGQLRDLQLANLELMKEFDYVCKSNNIGYWLDYGSMLGAVRHKGYIPWDDDIDIGMIRDDYEKIIEIFNSSTRNPDLYAEYSRDITGSIIIKIRHKNSNYIFIDIFPFDFCSEAVIGKNPTETTSKIKKTCKNIQKKYKNSTLDELNKAYKDYRDSLLDVPDKSDKRYVMRGVEFCGFPKNWFYKYETIYPLKKIFFENDEYDCLNNPDEFLKSLYGNYMAYPKKIGVGHTALLTLGDDEKNEIKKIINKE